jgi:membrane-anchored mycosin MYCP
MAFVSGDIDGGALLVRCTPNLVVTLVVPCLAVVASVAALPAQAANAAAADQLPTPTANCPGIQAAAAPTAIPWAQQALSFSSVWGKTQGAGVTVAVIDSGVDANPQFGNRVTTGPDLSGGSFEAPNGADCVGHGTAVASIIAAAPQIGVTFSGVAPRAGILSIKVANAETGISNAAIVTAITDAVELGASVINLSLDAANTPALRAAIQLAEDNNVVVVAAAGNDSDTTGQGPFYPAAYPGVLSVGAIQQDGSLAPISDTKTPVTVTAPGIDVTSAFPGTFPDAYSADDSGTSFATAFVSGVVALVRSAYPNLSAAQVVDRIAATADGTAGPGTGHGLVNPVQAVTAVLPEIGPEPGPTANHVPVTRAAPADARPRTIALAIAAAALAAGLLALATVIVIPAARRRRQQSLRTNGALPADPELLNQGRLHQPAPRPPLDQVTASRRLGPGTHAAKQRTLVLAAGHDQPRRPHFPYPLDHRFEHRPPGSARRAG